MKTGTAVSLRPQEVKRPGPEIMAGLGASQTFFGTAVEPDAPLTQKDRALLRLGLALGGPLERPDVHGFTRRALEAGWTVEQLRYASQVATKTVPTPELLTASMWVAEALNKA